MYEQEERPRLTNRAETGAADCKAIRFLNTKWSGRVKAPTRIVTFPSCSRGNRKSVSGTPEAECFAFFEAPHTFIASFIVINYRRSVERRTNERTKNEGTSERRNETFGCCSTFRTFKSPIHHSKARPFVQGAQLQWSREELWLHLIKVYSKSDTKISDCRRN